MSRREDRNDRSHCSSGGTALALTQPACVHERVISQEVVRDGEKWSWIHIACSHLRSANTSLLGLSGARTPIYLLRVIQMHTCAQKCNPIKSSVYLNMMKKSNYIQ